MVWLWIAMVWMLVAACVTLAVTRGIRIADRRAGSRVPNFIVQIDPAETPLPPLPRAVADLIPEQVTSELVPEQSTAGSARLEADAPSASRRRPKVRGNARTKAEKQSVSH